MALQVIHLLVAASAIGAAQHVEGGDREDDHDGDVVVVARRRPDALRDAVPIQEQSEAELATYGARSVDEIVERLRQQQGGQPFSILVNGRRLASIDDIGQLPAEALQSIRIYAPTEAARFGYGTRDRVLDLSLKSHFRSLAVDVDAGGATDGGAETASLKARGAVLNGDERLNGTLTGSRAFGLLSGDLPSRLAVPEVRPASRSLVPRALSLPVSLGASHPLGSGTLDVNIRGALSRTDSLAGYDDVDQTSAVRSLGTSTTYTTTFAGTMLNVSGDLNYGRTRSRAAGPSCARRGPKGCALQDLTTRVIGGSVAGVVDAKLADAPAGPVRLNGVLRRETSRTTYADVVNGRTGASTSSLVSMRAAVSLPLSAPAAPVASIIGALDLSAALDYNHATAAGGSLGGSAALSWSPVPPLSLGGSLTYRSLPPADQQSHLPEQVAIGVPIYDYRFGGIVYVEQVTGGSDLARQRTRDESFYFNFNRRIDDLGLALSGNYSSSTIIEPIVVLREPSPLLEEVRPDRYVRDASGRLLRVDAKPFNARSQSTSSITGSLGLSSSAQGGTLSWNVTLSGELRLRQSLRLAPGLPAIDTLRHPLASAVDVAGRGRWSMQASARTKRSGGTVSLDMTPGSRSEPTADPAGDVLVAPLIRIDVQGFLQPFRGSAASYRVEVAVQNLLNSRPDITTLASGARLRIDPYAFDPLGRVVTLSLRLPLQR